MITRVPKPIEYCTCTVPHCTRVINILQAVIMAVFASSN